MKLSGLSLLLAAGTLLLSLPAHAQSSDATGELFGVFEPIDIAPDDRAEFEAELNRARRTGSAAYLAETAGPVMSEMQRVIQLTIQNGIGEPTDGYMQAVAWQCSSLLYVASLQMPGERETLMDGAALFARHGLRRADDIEPLYQLAEEEGRVGRDSAADELTVVADMLMDHSEFYSAHVLFSESLIAAETDLTDPRMREGITFCNEELRSRVSVSAP